MNTLLAANQRLDVRVTCESKPLAGAPVFAFDGDKPIQTLTDRDGKAQLLLPTEAKLNGIVALDPQHGVSGQWSRSRRMSLPPDGVIPIALEPAKPHTFRVVDTEKGRLCDSYRWSYRSFRTSTSQRRIPTDAFDAGRTSTRMSAARRWCPGCRVNLGRLGVEIFDHRWKLDAVGRSQTGQRIHAGQSRPVACGGWPVVDAFRCPVARDC